MLPRLQYERLIKDVKSKLAVDKEEAEKKFINEQSLFLEMELINARHQQMIQYHTLEIQLVTNVALICILLFGFYNFFRS